MTDSVRIAAATLALCLARARGMRARSSLAGPSSMALPSSGSLRGRGAFYVRVRPGLWNVSSLGPQALLLCLDCVAIALATMICRIVMMACRFGALTM